MNGVRETTIGTEPIVELEAGGYIAQIAPGIGGNLISLNHIDKDMKLLRQFADIKDVKEGPCVYGTPVLIPPSRIKGGCFKFHGRTYQFPINEPSRGNSLHGFLQDKPFSIVSLKEDDEWAEAILEYKVDERNGIYAYLPHEFTCRLTFFLSKLGMKQTIEVTNHSKESMPFGLAYHTAFNLHFDGNDNTNSLRLQASIGNSVELNEDVVPTGNFMPLEVQDLQMRKAGVDPLDRNLDNIYRVDPLLIDDKEFHGAVLSNMSTGHRIVYKVGPKFKHWVIWNQEKEGSFLCIEPQTWLTNALNMDMDYDEAGIVTLKQGDCFTEETLLYCE